MIKVPFPYTDRPMRQRRPAFDVMVSDLAVAGLSAASLIRTVKVATIEAKEAERIGSLPMADRIQVTQYVLAVLAKAG